MYLVKLFDEVFRFFVYLLRPLNRLNLPILRNILIGLRMVLGYHFFLNLAVEIVLGYFTALTPPKIVCNTMLYMIFHGQ